MKRKILSVFITILVFCTCMFIFTACGDYEPPHTHSYANLKYDNEYHWFECNCKEKNNIVAHNIINGQCVCGYVASHTHEYNILKNNETQHWYECACGDKKNIENHNPGAEATETTDQKCTICNYVITPALGHVHALHLTKVDAEPQSCTEEGNIEYFTCSCGKWFTNNTATTEITDKSSVVIEKDEHQHTILKKTATEHWHECVCGDKKNIENHNPGAEATETTDQKCTICNYVITPALGHVHALHLTKVDAEPQSCTEEGNIEYFTCSCGKWFTNNTATTEITDKSSVVIEKDEHSYSTLKKTATDHWWECSCGDKERLEGHHGGTATCTDKAKCLICNQPYGNFAPHTYSEKWETNTTHHWKETICGCSVNEYYDEHCVDDSGLCSVCSAYIESTNGILYAASEDGTYMEVVGYEGNSSKIKIAEKYNNLPVKTIKDGAFALNTILTEVIISDNIEIIGLSAFYSCSNLKSVVIGNRVNSIGEFAFSNCNQLKTVEIPDSVINIGESAFNNCTDLFKVVIGNGVNSINTKTFYNCTNLKDLTIGNGVLSIAENAFSYCSSLTSVILPNNLNEIGGDAFSHCGSLSYIIIPDSVSVVGDYVFRYCANLEVIYCGAISKPIGWKLYWCSYSLNSWSWTIVWGYNYVLVDNTIYGIKDGIAAYIKQPEKIEGEFIIPSSITHNGNVYSVSRIEERAFSGCSELTSIVIPNSIKSIGRDVFYTSSSVINNIKKVFINDIESWCKISYESPGSNPLYAGNADLYLNEQKLTKIIIPNSITQINDYAFYNCKSLTGVIIPDSVLRIGNAAFWGCENLTEIKLSNNLTDIDEYAFGCCNSLTNIIIPMTVITINDYAFYLDNLLIYCKNTSQPIGWTEKWNSSNCPVIWGYKG